MHDDDDAFVWPITDHPDPANSHRWHHHLHLQLDSQTFLMAVDVAVAICAVRAATQSVNRPLHVPMDELKPADAGPWSSGQQFQYCNPCDGDFDRSPLCWRRTNIEICRTADRSESAIRWIGILWEMKQRRGSAYVLSCCFLERCHSSASDQHRWYRRPVSCPELMLSLLLLYQTNVDDLMTIWSSTCRHRLMHHYSCDCDYCHCHRLHHHLLLLLYWSWPAIWCCC